MSAQLLHRFAAIEQQLDTVLFRSPDDEEQGITAGGVAKTAAGAAVVGGAGYAAYKGHGAVIDRMGGLNAARRAGVARTGYVAAAGDLAKDAGAKVSAATTAAREHYGSLRAGAAEGLGLGRIAALRKAAVRGAQVLRHSVGPSLQHRIIALGAAIEGCHEFDLGLTDHLARHYGGPIGVAATSKKGKKWDAFKDSTGEIVKRTGHDTLVGGALGAGVGLATGAAGKSQIAQALLKRGRPTNHIAGKTAAVGALLGAAGGLTIGSIRGHHGKRQREIQERYHA